MSARNRLLFAGLRPVPDPSTSTDPRIRQLIAGLGALPVPAPEKDFRADLRRQLVAVTPRLVAEGAADADAETAPRPPRPVGSLARLRKPLTVLVSVMAVFVVLLGGAVFLSGRAVPGDSLYGFKRASENVQLSLTSSDTDKGKQYLSMASTRAGEVSDLLQHASAEAAAAGPVAAGAIRDRTAKLVTSTLDDQDSETRSAAQLLNAQSLRTASAGPLDALISWAPAQQARLQAIIARIPTGALHDRAVASQAVLTAALTRSTTLAGLVGAPCQATTTSDDYGPVPVAGCTATTPTTPSTPAPKGKTTAPHATVTPAPGSGSAGVQIPIPGVTTAGVTPAPTGPLPTQLPTQLPSSTPTLPITTGTCGLGVNLPPLVSVGIGTCGISIGVGGN
jgi:hypothetical protein